jgi:inosine-uridine nucleoside N-ribohydrolase
MLISQCIANHFQHPGLSPADTWQSLFASLPKKGNWDYQTTQQDMEPSSTLFTASPKPAHEEILSLLRDNEPDTITIVALGPLTNLATAAATDPETFLKAKEVVVMGGAVNETGNV